MSFLLVGTLKGSGGRNVDIQAGRLVILEFGGFVHLPWLPLGGGQIQQLGIVFATAYVIAESTELLNRLLRHRARRKPRRAPPQPRAQAAADVFFAASSHRLGLMCIVRGSPRGNASTHKKRPVNGSR